jgi:hypothetical protein
MQGGVYAMDDILQVLIDKEQTALQRAERGLCMALNVLALLLLDQAEAGGLKGKAAIRATGKGKAAHVLAAEKTDSFPWGTAERATAAASSKAYQEALALLEVCAWLAWEP